MLTGKMGKWLVVAMVVGAVLVGPLGTSVTQAQPSWENFLYLVDANDYYNEAVLYAFFGYYCDAAYFLYYAYLAAYDAVDYAYYAYYYYYGDDISYYAYYYSYYVYLYMYYAAYYSDYACYYDYSYIVYGMLYGYYGTWYNYDALYYAALSSGGGYYSKDSAPTREMR